MNSSAAHKQSLMPKWVKLIIGILLLPVCFGAASALSRVAGAAGNVQTFWVALIGGAACWLVVFLLLPKPMWIYVFGHELTHALWTWPPCDVTLNFFTFPAQAQVQSAWVSSWPKT